MSGLRIAFTANRNVTRADEGLISETVDGVCSLGPDEMIFGGARGGDTVALRAAFALRDAVTRLVVIVPDCVAAQPYEARRIIEAHADEVVELGLVITRADGFAAFKRRNEAMVERGSHLGAFWNADPRSGTWSCIAYARRIGRPWWATLIEGGDK